MSVSHSFAYVAILYTFERCLDSNPESFCSKQARYHPSPYELLLNSDEILPIKKIVLKFPLD
jgi:hypothetical protein